MEREFGWMERIARELGVSVSFNLLQSDAAPDLWRTMLGHLDRVNAAGLDIHAQIAGRPNGVLMTWGGTAVPFLPYPSYMPLHALPLDEKLARLRAPGLRERLCAEKPFSIGEFEDFIIRSRHKVFRLGDPPDYEPPAAQSAAAIATARGVDPNEVVFDWLMEDDGRGILYFPIFNYAANDCDVLHTLLSHPHTRLGLGDGGAHCGAICDASAPTFLLTFWTRGRTRGPTLPLERVVQILSWDTASFYGLGDRGRLVPGARADLNVLDLGALRLHAPRLVWDLPAGGRRFVQDADGYRATFVAGQQTFDRGEPTGARPGRLVRGRRSAPAA
jgi:N-acyl-D-aspartate/D-glutamate deacylase